MLSEIISPCIENLKHREAFCGYFDQRGHKAHTVLLVYMSTVYFAQRSAIYRKEEPAE